MSLFVVTRNSPLLAAADENAARKCRVDDGVEVTEISAADAGDPAGADKRDWVPVQLRSGEKGFLRRNVVTPLGAPPVEIDQKMFLTQLRFDVAAPLGATDHHYLFAVAVAESGVKNLQASPGSDATGPFKYSADRWAELVTEYGVAPPAIAPADRSDLNKQMQMAAREACGDADKIRQLLGRTAHNNELYVMHALGLKAGKAVLALAKDHPETPVEQALQQGGLSADETAKLVQAYPQLVKGSLAQVLDAAANALVPGFNRADELDPRAAPPQPKGTSGTVSGDIPPEGRALLDTIAGTESTGYDVLYGGRRFTDYSRHPNIAVPIISGPNQGKTSSAAGRYQFLFSTWDGLRKELNLPDFSPPSQDKAAWHLAQTVYHRKENRDLLADLQKGIYDKVGLALHSTWTSLPGGIESHVDASSFVTHFTANLAKYKT